MRQTVALAAVAAALVLGSASYATAGVPTDTVRDYTDAVVKVLEDPSLKVEDRIALRWHATGEAKEALEAFGSYVAGEVLAVRMEEAPAGDGLTPLDLPGQAVAVALARA